MNSLQSKVLLYFLIVAVIVIVLLGAVHSVMMNRLFDRYLQEAVSDNMLAIRSLLENHYERTGSLSGIEMYFRGRQMMGYAFVVADAEGQVLVGPVNVLGEKLSAADLQAGLPLVVKGRRVGTLLSNLLASRIQGVRTLEQEFRQSFNMGSLWAGVLVSFLALGLGVLISRKLIAPITELDRAANTLGSGNLEYRIPAKYHEQELASLVDSFNDMASKLERNERARRNLVADVAHELRTPLTIVRASLESILAGVSRPEMQQMASLHDEASRMSRLVEDLQDLSLAEAGHLSLKLESLEIAKEVEQVVERLQSVAEDCQISLEHSIEAPLSRVLLDRDRFRQVLFNVVWNAVQYSHDCGSVVVSQRLQDGKVSISVQDTGLGIKPEDLPHVFDRFYRGDKARSGTGTGLGLAIAKEFIESMQGTISVHSTLGKGTKFTIVFKEHV
jgi:signal transduction histidine kinase